MDKSPMKFPLPKEIIKENINNILDDKPLTIPIKYLLRDKRFIGWTKIKKKRDGRYCVICKKEINNNRKRYCNDKCKKIGERRRYNNPLKRIKRNKRARNYHKKMMKESLHYNIKTRIRDRLRDALRHFSKTGKIRKSNEYLDYKSIIEFLGPCPRNRKEYHIDHINPLCNFNFNDINQIRKAFKPENHQWLLIKDNIKKSKYERKN